eukprot:2931217-Pleurochrysis_carterae.AAC.2
MRPSVRMSVAMVPIAAARSAWCSVCGSRGSSCGSARSATVAALATERERRQSAPQIHSAACASRRSVVTCSRREED